MGRPAKIAGGFPKGAPGEKELVSERSLTVDEHDVETPPQLHVLEAVIEDQEVAPEIPDRGFAAFHPVLVDKDCDTPEVFREHERLVTGPLGVE